MLQRTTSTDPRRSRRCTPRPVLLALALLAAFFIWTPAPAQAVTPIASEPRARQQVDEEPGTVTLAFSRDVDPGVAKMIVTAPNGENVTDGALIVEGTNVTSQLREGLDRGTYTVHFRVDRADGDVEGGAFQFSYGPGSFTTLADRSWSGEANEPAVLGGTNPNSSDEPDPPSTAPSSPGIEVTREASTTDPEPTQTDAPSTIKPPAGGGTDVASGAANDPDTSTSAATASPAPNGGGSRTPFVVGGVLVLAAAGGAALGIWRTRKNKATPHE